VSAFPAGNRLRPLTAAMLDASPTHSAPALARARPPTHMLGAATFNKMFYSSQKNFKNRFQENFNLILNYLVSPRQEKTSFTLLVGWNLTLHLDLLSSKNR
jgi:hypothetical protein